MITQALLLMYQTLAVTKIEVRQSKKLCRIVCTRSIYLRSPLVITVLRCFHRVSRWTKKWPFLPIAMNVSPPLWIVQPSKHTCLTGWPAKNPIIWAKCSMSVCKDILTWEVRVMFRRLKANLETLSPKTPILPTISKSIVKIRPMLLRVRQMLPQPWSLISHLLTIATWSHIKFSRLPSNIINSPCQKLEPSLGQATIKAIAPLQAIVEIYYQK